MCVCNSLSRRRSSLSHGPDRDECTDFILYYDLGHPILSRALQREIASAERSLNNYRIISCLCARAHAGRSYCIKVRGVGKGGGRRYRNKIAIRMCVCCMRLPEARTRSTTTTTTKTTSTAHEVACTLKIERVLHARTHARSVGCFDRLKPALGLAPACVCVQYLRAAIASRTTAISHSCHFSVLGHRMCSCFCARMTCTIVADVVDVSMRTCTHVACVCSLGICAACEECVCVCICGIIAAASASA